MSEIDSFILTFSRRLRVSAVNRYFDPLVFAGELSLFCI